ncbi:MAG: IS3 family transposase, partial [Acidobacteria bacterium]|nr:IS3 family transposase [Acidobacteriota bacterium]
PRKYSDEMKDRAVRMVLQVRRESGQRQGAIAAVAEKLGINRETLRGWVYQSEVNSGQRPGTSTSDAQRIAELERENRELKRANEILRAASAFFGPRDRAQTAQIVEFIDKHRDQFGVDPVCQVLGVPAGSYRAVKARPPSARRLRDERLKAEILRVYDANFQVYGARKIWRQLRREGIETARCTVERLMRELGIAGVVRGRRRFTTVADPSQPVPADLLKRDFTAPAPNVRWVADFTEVPTWGGKAYCAFVIDCFSRFIVGWRIANHMRTDLALDALEMALWQRKVHKGQTIHHSDHGSQYLSIRYTTTLSDAGLNCSAGSIGDSYDNALAETVIGLYKAELVRRHGPWRTIEHLELATLEWVDWFNQRRLHSWCGNIPPAEHEA